jgi:hypothetical protein
MEENDITQKLNEALKEIGARSYEIDEFEKLYAITSAKSSRGSLLTDENFKEDDFDSIQTLEQYASSDKRISNLLETIKERSNDNQEEILQTTENASNYYVIPRQTTQKIRSGNEEMSISVKTQVIVDGDGYSLYTITNDGNVSMSNLLKDEIKNYLNQNYSKAIYDGIINPDEVIENMCPETSDKLVVFVNTTGVSLKDIGKEVDNYVLSKGMDKLELDEIKNDQERADINPNLEDDTELTQITNKEQEEVSPKTEEPKENKKEDKEIKDEKEELNKASIDDKALATIAKANNCKIDKINVRILGTREALDYAEELTGANLQRYKGRRSYGC